MILAAVALAGLKIAPKMADRSKNIGPGDPGGGARLATRSDSHGTSP